MTLPIERARSRRPITWLTVIGVLLLPALIGGVLVTALYNPTERLDALTAAIVNDDEPVTIDDQYVPLGRQLTAGLVEGSDDVDSNLTWTVSNTEDAARGLADGTYDAVVTIPSNFSAAATSTRPGETPERATIQVTTPPDSLVVDDAITSQVTQTAANLMGTQLSEMYLENVLLGFTTIGDQLGEAASGAHKLATGAAKAADGAAQLPDGATQLTDGARQLGDGATQLGGGASQLGDGATKLGGGASALGDGLAKLAAGARDGATGAESFAAKIDAGAAQLRADGLVPAELTGVAEQTASTAEMSAGAAAGVAQGLAGLAAACDPAVFGPEYCGQVSALADGAAGAQQAAEGTQALAAGTRDGLAQFAAAAPEQFASQLTEISGGVRSLGGGMTTLAGGIDQTTGGARDLASGATQLASGAGDLATGASGLASGASRLADGGSQLADGAGQLSTGVSQLADGTRTLASGLDEAVASIPSYTDSEARSLADVVANPVETDGAGSSLFGASAIPLLAALALWFGGLASFIALRAVSGHALTSRAPSIVLALRAFLPAAAIGAVQGLLVAIVVQLAASYDPAAFVSFASVAVVAGVSFAAINQALVAVLGGAGRWIAALVGVLAIATGVVSTVPGALMGIAHLMPTMPAYTAMLAAITPATGLGAGVIGLIVWGALSFAATVIAVARHRTTTARAVLTAAPA